MTRLAMTENAPWLEFTIPGNPRPKERPRFSGHAYTSAVTAAAEREIAWEAKKALRSERCVEGPLSVRIDFYRDSARRVDVDNLGKLVLDALNRFVWADDAQIEELTLTKAVDRKEPRTVVRVWRAEAELRKAAA